MFLSLLFLNATQEDSGALVPMNSPGDITSTSSGTERKPDNLSAVPWDVIDVMLEFLDGPSSSRLARVSQRFRENCTAMRKHLKCDVEDLSKAAAFSKLLGLTIRGTPPKEKLDFSPWPQLQILSLKFWGPASDHLPFPFNDSLQKLTQLTSLHWDGCIRNNDLTLLEGALPESLKSLSLESNMVDNLEPLADALEQVPDLTSFSLYCDSVTNLSPLEGGLQHVPQLTSLSLRGGSVTDLAPLAPALQKVPQLTNLFLQCEGVTNLAPLEGALKHVPDLTDLSLRCFSVTNLAPLYGPLPPSLTSLTVNGEEIKKPFVFDLLRPLYPA